MKKSIRFSLILLLILLSSSMMALAQIPEKFQRLIDCGEFTTAQQLMKLEITTNTALPPARRLELSFQIERLERIRKDFNRTQEEIMEYIKKYVQDVKEDDLRRWEKEKSMEFKMIDGERKYFRNAGPNLFRIDKKLKAIKKKKDEPSGPRIYNRLADIKSIIREARATGQKFVNPVRSRITYTLSVNANAVPDGEIIRCWLPFPREIPKRQVDVRLISSMPESHLIADNDKYLQRSIYFEQEAVADQKTEFQVVFEFTNHAVYQKIDPQRVKPVKITDELKPFLAERPPHVVFTDEIRQLSRQIVGDETNPYLIARKIFQWISDNIPWASAREYSTFANISDYVYQNRHCDCGMHEIFFMTLCRMNGIPTRWQSGWTTTPGQENMHDWGEIYFEPYGWLPVDADVGVVDSKNEDEKWFFIGGMDAYRLIVNDDYSQPLFPAKIHFRSETLDFQRGEVEWKGGNLYFDQWDWEYDVEYLE